MRRRKIARVFFRDPKKSEWIASEEELVLPELQAASQYLFSRDYARFYLGCRNGTVQIYLWNQAKPEKIGTIRAHQGPVTVLSASSDGRFLLTGSGGGKFKIWEKGGRLRCVLGGNRGFLVGAAFSPRGDRILTAAMGSAVRTLGSGWEVPAHCEAFARGGDCRRFPRRRLPPGHRLHQPERSDRPCLPGGYPQARGKAAFLESGPIAGSGWAWVNPSTGDGGPGPPGPRAGGRSSGRRLPPFSRRGEGSGPRGAH